MARITFIHPVHSEVIDGAMHYSTTPINMADESAIRHLAATYNRALRMIGADDTLSAEVHIGERTSPRFHKDANGNQAMHDAGGWLEHTIVIRRDDKHYMTIGAIQRQPGADSEFHS